MIYFQLLFTGCILAGYLVTAKILANLLDITGRRKNAAPKRARYIAKVFNIGLVIVSFFLLCIVWGVDYGSLLVFGSSVIAIMGVAFVAQWSILSNITASIIIFFSYPARIGDYIRIMDGDNSVEGMIVDINLFQVLIEDREHHVINYPNNLIIQKPMVKLKELSAVTVPEDETQS